MNELKLAYDYIIVSSGILCFFVGHTWHSFRMRKEKGSEYYRCCMRCEKTERLHTIETIMKGLKGG